MTNFALAKPNWDFSIEESWVSSSCHGDFLKRPTGTNINDLNESQLDLLTRTDDLEPGDSHRIGDMEFEMVNDK